VDYVRLGGIRLLILESVTLKKQIERVLAGFEGLEPMIAGLPKLSATEYSVRTEDDVMPSTLKAPRSRRLNLRTSAQQEKLMRRGAQERGESLTDFIVRSACAEAEQTLADQRRFSLDADQWNAFVAALDRPAQAKPRLRRLLSEPSVLEQQHS
jgi:uncharacterized protein (DUF1778 family)